MWSRIHLIPVLQAEEDRDLVRRHYAQQAREKELLGAETKVYNNDRCVGNLAECETSLKRAKYADTGAGLFVLHTQSHPARLRNRRRYEAEIKVKGQESHVVNIAGSGAFFHFGNHRPMTVSNVHSNFDIQATCAQETVDARR
jgi:hypothetical protein